MTPEQLQTLRTEIDLPAYSGMDDERVARALNATGVQVDRDSLTGGDIASCVKLSELGALTAGQQTYVIALFACGSITVSETFRQQMAGLFGQGTDTRANLLALFKRDGSRAQQLGLPTVTPSDVADSRRL